MQRPTIGGPTVRRLLRTIQAIALLLGFYAMALAILAVIALVDDAVISAAMRSEQGLGLWSVLAVSVLLAYPLVRGLLMGHPGNRHRPPGIRVSPQEQPRLWQRVRAAAEAAGVRPPSGLWLVDVPNASVWQGSWLLGLIPGRRRMMIGLPLLSGLTVAELDAVIAHELGHFANGDTLLLGLTARSRAGLGQVVSGYSAKEGGLGHGLNGLFTRYARFCLRVTQAGARRQELAADAAAARLTGPETVIRALRATPLLTRAHERYRSEYVEIGAPQELGPRAEEIQPGFRRFLETASWREEAAALRRNPSRERRSVYDSHPPVSERIAHLQGLGEVAREPRAELLEPAHTLLDDADATAGRACARRRGAAGLRQVDWDALAAACGNAELEKESAALWAAVRAALRRKSDLPELLDAIDAGRWREITGWMPREGMSRTVTSDAARSMGSAAASDALYSLLLAQLIAQGRGRWTLDWEQGGKRLDLDPGLDALLGPAVDAVADAEPPSAAPLRALLSAPVPAARAAQ
ncbi:Zn-dependent protease with chaperone function [Streptacidiphilus sp. MAP12-33]|uniref:M48 family metallopeptidase n=1 Tax=Streptacidiphilus sp. MAP12-33 TaxID=3156266 RepID=UPI0035192086